MAPILGGCDTYPPASEVAACATARFGTDLGAFSSAARSSDEEVIIYAKRGSSDRATVVYRRSHGPVSTHQEISFGNHGEIQGAVEAIRYCAHVRGHEKKQPGP